MPTKHGNDNFWCFLEPTDSIIKREIAIWKGPTGEAEIIARATDQYEAKRIVDALCSFKPSSDKNTLDKKSVTFLNFVRSHCKEPYATRATNALMWEDKEEYQKLLEEFPVLYS